MVFFVLLQEILIFKLLPESKHYDYADQKTDLILQTVTLCLNLSVPVMQE